MEDKLNHVLKVGIINPILLNDLELCCKTYNSPKFYFLLEMMRRSDCFSAVLNLTIRQTINAPMKVAKEIEIMINIIVETISADQPEAIQLLANDSMVQCLMGISTDPNDKLDILVKAQAMTCLLIILESNQFLMVRVANTDGFIKSLYQSYDSVANEYCFGLKKTSTDSKYPFEESLDATNNATIKRPREASDNKAIKSAKLDSTIERKRIYSFGSHVSSNLSSGARTIKHLLLCRTEPEPAHMGIVLVPVYMQVQVLNSTKMKQINICPKFRELTGCFQFLVSKLVSRVNICSTDVFKEVEDMREQLSRDMFELALAKSSAREEKAPIQLYFNVAAGENVIYVVSQYGYTVAQGFMEYIGVGKRGICLMLENGQYDCQFFIDEIDQTFASNQFPAFDTINELGVTDSNQYNKFEVYGNQIYLPIAEGTDGHCPRCDDIVKKTFPNFTEGVGINKRCGCSKNQ